MFEKLDYKIDQIHLTSDTHFLHKNIACGTSVWSGGYRDFVDQFVMTDEIVKNINQQVKKTDLFINAGDHSFGGEQNVKILRDRVDCENIYFHQGNHDQHIKLDSDVFSKVTQVGYYQVGDIKLVVGHFPFSDWYKKREGSYMLYGHCHAQESKYLKLLHDECRIIDVGIDNAYKIFGVYRPFKLSEIIEILKNKI